jgi:hypothetical protein
MTPRSRLDSFVNRIEERDRFCELLSTGEKPIMIVWGKNGLGKTWLLEWMMHECAQRQLVKSELVWDETRKYEEYGIMRKIRDDVDPSYFKPFTDLISYYTEPQYKLQIIVEGDLSVANKAEFVESKFNDLVGVMIKDNEISFPRTDIQVPMEERLIRLTDLFIPSLAAATKDRPLWIFFDVFDRRMSPETRKWIQNELFAAILDGKLPNVKVVMSINRKPSPDGNFLDFVEEASLQPFERQYVEEYLLKRGVDERLGVDEKRRAGMVDVIMAEAEGVPLKVAKLVAGVIKMLEKERRRTVGG